MSSYVTDGIVLRTRNMGEADQAVVLLTRTDGKVTAAARGVRRPRSRLLGPCQLFTLARFRLFRRRGGLHRMDEGHVMEAFRPLREDLWRMACASYAAELVDVALPEGDPQPDVFALLLATLHRLALEPGTWELETVVRQFELRLFALLGYRPRLEQCSRCRAPTVFGAGQKAVFHAASGGVVCETCSLDVYGEGIALGPETVAMMRQILRVGLSRLRMLKLSPRAVKELGAAMAQWSDYHLERTPRSREFLQSLAAQGDSGSERNG